jgi:hypothetical protein
MLKRKNLIITLIAIIISLEMIGCENDSSSATKPLTPSTFGTVEGTVYLAGTTSTVPGVVIVCGEINSTTQSDGKYLLKNVPSGYQTLKATRADFTPFAQNIDVVENNTVRYDVFITAASTIKSIYGTAFQMDNNEPLDSVRVILISDTTFTDALGKYQLPIISQGLKPIKAEKVGYKTFSNLVFISNSGLEYDIKLEKIP